MSDPPQRTLVKLSPAIAVIVGEQVVQLRAGDESVFVLETRHPNALAAWLDSLRQPHDQAPESPSFSRDYVTSLHGQLLGAGLLIDASVNDSPNSRYWVHWPRTLQGEPVRPPKGHVRIVSPDPFGAILANVLSDQGFTCHSTPALGDGDDERHDLAWVIAWESPHLSFALDANERAARHRVPCLFVDLSHGRHATVGPFYLPGEGSCYACFRRRWREGSASRAEHEAAEQAMLATRRPLPAFGCLPAFRHGAAAFAALELTALAVGHRSLNTLNRALTIDWEGLSTWLESAWRFPWCEVCGTQLREAGHAK